jgi:hypothetical protein
MGARSEVHYTITIGTTEILIDPSIVDWVPETPSLPIQ